ncbi:MAG: dihydrodipicolinate synthase family protein [Opitutaceae bacterium]
MNSSPRTHLIWSAAPTPLLPDFRVDVAAVERVVEAAVADGLHGLFIAGSCGEGPWLTNGERKRLVKAAAGAARGRLKIGAQVSDNSVPRVRENAQDMAEAGADIAIIAAPATFLNATPDRIVAHFMESTEACPIPVGIYDLGRHRPIMIPENRLKDVYLHPKVVLVKDSSASPERRQQALAARREKPSLLLFNGDEFRVLEYLDAGYDNLMLGGASATAPLLQRVIALFDAGKMDEARAADAELKRVLWGIYGGESIACWLHGLKYYMVRRGLFSGVTSFLGYPLSDECRAFVDRYVAHGA